MEVVPGLHWVESIWDTKVYLLFEGDRLFIVDAATPGRAGAVWRHLDLLGYPPGAVDEIWITHGDVDHMGSAAALKDGSGAQVVAHRADEGHAQVGELAVERGGVLGAGVAAGPAVDADEPLDAGIAPGRKHGNHRRHIPLRHQNQKCRGSGRPAIVLAQERR